MKKIELILDNLLGFAPKFLRLPVEYHCRKVTGRIEREIFYIDKLIPRKGRAIDIGANRGLYTYALSQICSVVEAFEPQPWCTEGIVEYGKRFNKNINVYNCGISNSNGSLALKVPIIRGKIRTTLSTGLASFCDRDGEHNGEYKYIDTPIRKLDDYNFKNVVFIKIDVEGYEKEVIDGSRETILREKPVLLIEIEQRHLGSISMETIINEVTEFGYNGFFFQDEHLIDIEKFSLEKHQNIFQQDIMSNAFSGHYVNNFIFTPSSLVKS